MRLAKEAEEGATRQSIKAEAALIAAAAFGFGHNGNWPAGLAQLMPTATEEEAPELAVESLEETAARFSKGSVKHAIFEVGGVGERLMCLGVES